MRNSTPSSEREHRVAGRPAAAPPCIDIWLRTMPPAQVDEDGQPPELGTAIR